MKKLMTLFMLFSVLFLTGCNFLDDEETENIEVDYTNYIIVSTIDDLKEMDINKSYELDQDIDLNGEEWTPLGTFNRPFRGHFNGNGYTISNFIITKNNQGYNGLFGYIEGNVENLNVTDFNINITSDFLVNVGGLAGMSYGSISNVTVDGFIKVTSTQGNVYAGLLVGNALTSLQKLVIAKEFKPMSIYNNHATGILEMNGSEINYVGGLIGKAQNIKIYDNDIIDVDIEVNSGLSTYVGGVVGHYFLYDIETTDSSLSVDKDLLYRNIAKVTFNITSSTDLSLGGFAGYNQNANVFNNFVLIDLNVSVTKYQVGLTLGENWMLDIGKNLSVLESELIESQLMAGSYGSNIGSNYVNTITEEGLYASYISTDNYSLQGTEVNTTDLDKISFYENQFTTLERPFIEKIIQLLFTE
ncbi:MAG: hypothetical protein PF513_00920 [Tenericutes bacterium]|jgi:hypothetical protein|nr:hypothetical protein [Mycoplasmatota bacterium]